jgi:hypothetical protein
LNGGKFVKTEKTIDSCFILPILPHKIGNVRDFWDDVSEKYRGDTEDQFKGVGIKRMLAFLQAMPEKGDFLIMFMQSADSLAETLHAMFATDIEYSKYLTEQFKDFTGVDLSKEENTPKLRLLMDWKDSREYLEEKNMLKMPWCFVASIKPGKTDDLLKLLTKVGKSRMSEIEDLLRHHDIVRSLTYLQHTLQGDFIVRHILASNPLDELIMAFTSCGDKMCNYVKGMAMEFTGIDFSDPKNLPHVELLFKWDEAHGFETAEQTIAYTE